MNQNQVEIIQILLCFCFFCCLPKQTKSKQKTPSRTFFRPNTLSEMSVSHAPPNHLSFFETDELNELNEEWIEKESGSEPETNNSTVNRNGYGSTIIHGGSINNGTTRLEPTDKPKVIPKWKLAIQDIQSSNGVNEEDSNWNQFFQSPGQSQEESRSMSPGPEDNQSKSPLKVFQNYDTYTNARLENMLSMLDGEQAPLPRSPESVPAYNESESHPSIHKSANSDSDLYSSTNHDRPEWNSANRRDITTQDFMDNADSLMKKLMGSAPNSREGPGSPTTAESNLSTDSIESLDSATGGFTGGPIYVGHTETPQPPEPLRQSSVIVHGQGSMDRQNENKRNIGVIKQEDVKNIIPKKIGSMNYDAEARIWRRNGKAAALEEEVQMDTTDEPDVFQGIDDLSEEVHICNDMYASSSQTERSVSIKVESPPGSRTPETQETGLQRKLQSIKPCLVGTPRSATLTGGSDKVSFQVSSVTRHTAASPDTTQITPSYSQSMDFVVQALTDRYPDQLFWDRLETVDVSGCGLESVAGLATVCPQVRTLNAAGNKLTVLQGVPPSVTDLNVARNRLTGWSGFAEAGAAGVGLANVQYLDVSGNDGITSFTCLAGLLHLRSLTANGCPVTSLHGLAGIPGLLRLTVQHARLDELDGQVLRAPLLQALDVSHNRVRRVRHLGALKSLRLLNLDYNAVEELHLAAGVGVSKVCVRHNALKRVDVDEDAGLRVLYADGNAGLVLHDTDALRHLDSLSLDVHAKTLVGSLDALNDIHSLKLHGTTGTPPLQSFPFTDAFLNLHKLDLVGLGLTSLPRGFAQRVPNLRELNLAFNGLGDDDLAALHGISRLSQVCLYGNRVGKVQACLGLVRACKALRLLDLRGNAVTAGVYPELAAVWQECGQDKEKKQEDGPYRWYGKALAREFQAAWLARDLAHARDLESGPAPARAKRAHYRGILVSAGAELRWLDGTLLDEERVESIRSEWAQVLNR